MVDDRLQSVKTEFGFVRNEFPSALEAHDGRLCKGADDGHERMVVGKVEQPDRDLRPLFDDNRSSLWVQVTEDVVRNKVGKVSG